jgi:hypothetical protein
MNRSLMTAIFPVGLGIRTELLNSVFISDWHFLMWMFHFGFSGCDWVELLVVIVIVIVIVLVFRIGIMIVIEYGIGERSKRPFEKG